MLDIPAIRAHFPSLARLHDNRPVVYLDGPAGTQVPQAVVDAIADAMLHHNANRSGQFATSREVDVSMANAHRAAANLLGASDPSEICFGANMTTMTLHFSRSIARTWKPGDEILVSRLDHDANFTPWVLAARDANVNVKYIDVNKADATLDMDSLDAQLTDRTRLVAVTAASNAVGSLTPIAEIARRVHAVGAELFVDAVHYAPHRSIDVTEWDCDYLVCSAYKFFGPHIGILYGRSIRMDAIHPYKLRPSPNRLPDRWMTGTQNHPCIVGVAAAIEYLADLSSIPTSTSNLRPRLVDAMSQVAAYESELIARLIRGLKTIPNIRIFGIADPSRFAERAPTVAFVIDGIPSIAIAKMLGDQGIFVWHGNYYALPLTESLGTEPDGMVRIGCMHYNTFQEIDRTIEAIREIEQTHAR
jgi:cysteine desulfurase family protein (TIGR01976 family)